jgi:autotransporter-associated beta strand protein
MKHLPFTNRNQFNPFIVFAKLVFLAMLAFGAAAQATTYYSQGSADPGVLANWNTVRGGGGTGPANFTSADTFVIQIGHSMATTAAWTLSSGSAKIQIESGGTLTANNLVTSANFQIDNGGTYVHNAVSGSVNGSVNDIPGSTSRSFGASSTVEVQKWGNGGTSPGPLPTTSWGNLKINVATLAGSWNMTGVITSVGGNLIVQQTGGTAREFRLTGAATFTLNVAGNIQVTGGVLNLTSGAGVPTVTITGQLLVTGGWLRSSGAGVPVVTVNGNSGKTSVTGGGTNTLSADLANPPGSPVADAITLDNGFYGDDAVDYTLNVNRGITVNAGGGTITMSSGRTMTIAGNITGPGSLTKSYISGTTVNLSLAGNNDFLGNFNILGGGVRFNSSAAAGRGDVVVSMPVGGTANTTLRNTGVAISTLTNNLVLMPNNGLLISLDSDVVNTFVIAGKISGVGSAIHGVNSGGTVELSGDNSLWTGGLSERRGTLRLGHKNALGTAPLTVTPVTTAGAMPVSWQATTPLTGASSITNAVNITITNTAPHLTVSGANDLEMSGPISLGVSGTVSPIITNINTGATILSGPISGTGFGLTVMGNGTLTLAGNNTYDGATVIGGGTLRVNNISGSGTGSGAVTVQSGATLGGSGTIAGGVTIASGGSVGAGSSAGLLTIGNGLDLSSGGTNFWELAANSTANPGTDFDQISLTGGNLVLGGSSRVRIKFIGTATIPDNSAFWQAAHSWTVVSLSGTAANPGSTTFSAIDGTNGITAGTFTTSVSGGSVVLNYTPSATSPPVPAFVASPLSGVRPLTVYFTNQTSGATTYSWNFGDGDSSASLNPVKVYTNAGIYTVILTATGPGGSASATNNNYITVTNPPAPVISGTIANAGQPNGVLTWSSLSGVTYEVQYKDNLTAASWSILGTVPATGPTSSITDTNLPVSPQRFYQVIAK